MIRIQNLDVRFEVEGSDERELFKQLFHECIEEWAAEERERDERDRRRAQDGKLGGGEYGVEGGRP